MPRKIKSFSPCSLSRYLFLFFLLCCCSQAETGACPSQPMLDLSAVLAYAGDDQYIFRYPLDELSQAADPPPANFLQTQLV